MVRKQQIVENEQKRPVCAVKTKKEMSQKQDTLKQMELISLI